jgi:hypothetical protein
MSHYQHRSPPMVPIRLRPSRLCPSNSQQGRQDGHPEPFAGRRHVGDDL